MIPRVVGMSVRISLVLAIVPACRHDDGDAPAKPEVVAVMGEARDQLQAMADELPDDDPILGPILSAEIGQTDKMIEMVRRGPVALPIDATLSAAIRPMGRGRFDEARRAIAAYRDAHPDNRMASLTHALCDLELGDYASAHRLLSSAFESRDEFPAMDVLRGFAARLTKIDGTPSPAQIMDSYTIAHAEARVRVEARGERYLRSDPLIADPALVRFLTLGAEPADPLFLSPDRFNAEAADAWERVAAEVFMIHTGHPAAGAWGDEPSLRQLRMIEWLSDWYGEFKGFKDAGSRPEFLAAMKELQAIDPDNGGWRLLTIEFDDSFVDEDADIPRHRPLNPEELNLFLSACSSNVLYFEHPEYEAAMLRMMERAEYPYRHHLKAAFKLPYNVLGHLRNIAYRADSAARGAVESGENDSALRIGDSILQLADAIRAQRSWDVTQVYLVATTYRKIGQELRALASSEHVERHATELDALARLEIRYRAMSYAEGGGQLRELLPLRMLNDAHIADSSPQRQLSRARIAWNADPELRPLALKRFTWPDVPTYSFPPIVVGEVQEAIPEILDRFDGMEFENQWRAVWAIGRLGGRASHDALMRFADRPDVIGALARRALERSRKSE